MEALSVVLKRKISQDLIIPLSIMNFFYFVNDLLVLPGGNVKLATYMEQTLGIHSFLGLEATSIKSLSFFSRTCESKKEITSIFYYQVGEFP